MTGTDKRAENISWHKINQTPTPSSSSPLGLGCTGIWLPGNADPKNKKIKKSRTSLGTDLKERVVKIEAKDKIILRIIDIVCSFMHLWRIRSVQTQLHWKIHLCFQIFSSNVLASGPTCSTAVWAGSASASHPGLYMLFFCFLSFNKLIPSVWGLGSGLRDGTSWAKSN